MPYIPAGRRRLVAFLVAGAAMVLPAAAQADSQQWIASTLASLSTTGPTCATPPLSQPFSAFNDFAYYALAPGESTSEGFLGDGWTLLGGASAISATLPDGTTGNVLDLPSGSLAISPPMCVDLTYPKARTMVRNVIGGGGVKVYVSYADSTGWGKAKDGGNAHGRGNAWGASDKLNTNCGKDPGWQLARFAFAPEGEHNDYQLYNFYVDPYAKG